MSSKSMSGMFLANHSSMGLRSNRFSALSRNFVIHSGSDLRCEMSRTTCSFTPFFGVVDVLLGVVPAELVLAQIDAGTAIADCLLYATSGPERLARERAAERLTR